MPLNANRLRFFERFKSASHCFTCQRRRGAAPEIQMVEEGQKQSVWKKSKFKRKGEWCIWFTSPLEKKNEMYGHEHSNQCFRIDTALTTNLGSGTVPQSSQSLQLKTKSPSLKFNELPRPTSQIFPAPRHLQTNHCLCLESTIPLQKCSASLAEKQSRSTICPR